MSASDIAYRIQDEQGWTDATLLDIVLDYIGSQQSDDAFEDYLTEHAAEENDYDGYLAPDGTVSSTPVHGQPAAGYPVAEDYGVGVTDDSDVVTPWDY